MLSFYFLRDSTINFNSAIESVASFIALETSRRTIALISTGLASNRDVETVPKLNTTSCMQSTRIDSVVLLFDDWIHRSHLAKAT